MVSFPCWERKGGLWRDLEVVREGAWRERGKDEEREEDLRQR